MKGWSPFTKHDGTTSSTTHYADGSPKSKREVDFSKRHEDEKVKAGKNSDDENQNLPFCHQKLRELILMVCPKINHNFPIS